MANQDSLPCFAFVAALTETVLFLATGALLLEDGGSGRHAPPGSRHNWRVNARLAALPCLATASRTK